MRLTSTRSLALAVALSTILILSVAYYWPMQGAYSPFNVEWDGCSEIASTSHSVILASYDRPLPLGSSLLAIIGPATQFSRDESLKIRGFMEAGGTVLLADDFGTGNSLLEHLSVPAKFSKKPLADLLYYSKTPSFPFIFDFALSSVTANITALLLNRPSYLETGNLSQVTTLASSSPFSFIDVNGDNRPAPNETISSYPVVASTGVGTGLLVLVSDPGIFTNEMIHLYGNMQFFQNLLKMGNASLFIDVAHLTKAPLTDARISFRNDVNSVRDVVLFSKNGPYIQSLAALIIIFVLLFQIRRGQREKDRAGRLRINLCTQILSCSLQRDRGFV